MIRWTIYYGADVEYHLVHPCEFMIDLGLEVIQLDVGKREGDVM
jgi:hypothetical protein